MPRTKKTAQTVNAADENIGATSAASGKDAVMKEPMADITNDANEVKREEEKASQDEKVYRTHIRFDDDGNETKEVEEVSIRKDTNEQEEEETVAPAEKEEEFVEVTHFGLVYKIYKGSNKIEAISGKQAEVQEASQIEEAKLKYREPPSYFYKEQKDRDVSWQGVHTRFEDEEDVSVEQQEVPELESIMAATLSLGSGESSEVSGKKKAAGKK